MEYSFDVLTLAQKLGLSSQLSNPKIVQLLADHLKEVERIEEEFKNAPPELPKKPGAANSGRYKFYRDTLTTKKDR